MEVEEAQAPAVEVDSLFESFDPDRSGTIEYKELQKSLAAPKAGSSGKRAGPFAPGGPVVRPTPSATVLVAHGHKNEK